MSNPTQIIRPLSVYLDGDKVAEIISGSYKINTGRDAVITDGGYSGHTGGAITATISAKQLVGVTTTRFAKLYASIRSKGYVGVALPVEGSIHQVVGVIKELGATWDHAKGSADGDWTFEGGEPEDT
jgi:hypothetical protein